MENLLADGSFYFTPGGEDLTRVLQLGDAPPDERFVWNGQGRAALTALLDGPLSAVGEACVVDLMRGYVGMRTLPMVPSTTLLVIARRSRHRVGFRFKSRGADVKGNCSNYVETEQIVMHHGHVAAYVQVRGSVPIFWRQDGDMAVKPKIRFGGDDDDDVARQSADAFNKHMHGQIAMYGGSVTAVTLLKDKGEEKKLQDRFIDMVHSLDLPEEILRIVMFDFSGATKRVGAEMAQQLLNEATEMDQDRFGYFRRDPEGKLLEAQRGVFRINCLDCLDRTNVVMALFARRVLLQTLNALDLIPTTPSAETIEPIQAAHTSVWTEHGHAMSRQYAGSDALKTDITETGRRTTRGRIRDGVSSMRRYVSNNFRDAVRLKTVGVLLGTYSFDVDSWDKEVAAAMEKCRGSLTRKYADEKIVAVWFAISVSKLGVEQECILILTQSAYHRFMYNFIDAEIMREDRVALTDVKEVISAYVSPPTGSSALKKLWGKAKNLKGGNKDAADEYSEDGDAAKGKTTSAYYAMHIKRGRGKTKTFKAMQLGGLSLEEHRVITEMTKTFQATLAAVPKSP